MVAFFGLAAKAATFCGVGNDTKFESPAQLTGHTTIQSSHPLGNPATLSLVEAE
jgi:hypothetical protein